MATLHYVDQDDATRTGEKDGELIDMLAIAFDMTQDDEPHHSVDDDGSHSWTYCDGGLDVVVMTGELDNMSGSS